MKILWFLPKWPNPPVDGATRAHMALLTGWREEKATLAIAVYSDMKTEKEVAELKKITGAHIIYFLKADTSSRPLLILKSFLKHKNLPATAAKFKTKEAKNSLPDLSSFTHLVFDGLHPAALFLEEDHFVFPAKAKIIYRAHNIEAELWLQVLQKQQGLLKKIYTREFLKMQRFESLMMKEASLIATVSERDKKHCEKQYHPKKIEAVEIGMPQKKLTSSFPETMNLLFVGRLDWYPNHEGLSWLLEKVWPAVLKKRKDLSLDIVGGFASEELLKTIHKAENVRFHGRVPDVDLYYGKCALTLIPIWTGSGTRVKAIESAAHQRSFLTTSKGVEGVELSSETDFLLADDEEAWIKKLSAINVTAAKTLGQKACETLMEKYDQDKIRKKFISLMEQA